MEKAGRAGSLECMCDGKGWRGMTGWDARVTARDEAK